MNTLLSILVGIVIAVIFFQLVLGRDEKNTFKGKPPPARRRSEGMPKHDELIASLRQQQFEMEQQAARIRELEAAMQSAMVDLETSFFKSSVPAIFACITSAKRYLRLATPGPEEESET